MTSLAINSLFYACACSDAARPVAPLTHTRVLDVEILGRLRTRVAERAHRHPQVAPSEPVAVLPHLHEDVGVGAGEVAGGGRVRADGGVVAAVERRPDRDRPLARARQLHLLALARKHALDACDKHHTAPRSHSGQLTT